MLFCKSIRISIVFIPKSSCFGYVVLIEWLSSVISIFSINCLPCS
nr:MAG TPA: hypothetical protein [Bacteriophage sp.]